MRVLVTGGAGFIGSHVLDRLLAAGVAPRCFDRRVSPYHRPGEVETVIGDVLDPDGLRAAMAGCDAVLHLAAAADVGEVASDPSGSERLNAHGTLSVLEAARATGVPHVVYASTIWVYSDGGAPRVDEEQPLTLPRHVYTATKLAGEAYCRAYASLYGLRTTILRFGIPYGPRARPAAVVPAFVERALAHEPLSIAGDGRQSRRFVYVEDLADGVVRALGRDGDGCRVYNLVGERDVTIRELAEVVRDVVGSTEIVHAPARTADFRGVEVSGARAAAELGWSATTPFEEGVRRYVAWRLARDLPLAAPAAVAVAPTPAWRARLARVTAGVVTPMLGLIAVLGTLVAFALTVGDVDPGTSKLTMAGLVSFCGLIGAALVVAVTAATQNVRRGRDPDPGGAPAEAD